MDKARNSLCVRSMWTSCFHTFDATKHTSAHTRDVHRRQSEAPQLIKAEHFLITGPLNDILSPVALLVPFVFVLMLKTVFNVTPALSSQFSPRNDGFSVAHHTEIEAVELHNVLNNALSGGDRDS